MLSNLLGYQINPAILDKKMNVF